MTREERMMWVCFMLMALILGWSAGRVIPRDDPQEAEARRLEKEETELRFTRLGARVDALEAVPPPRCFSVTTDKLDVAIFPVDRIK